MRHTLSLAVLAFAFCANAASAFNFDDATVTEVPVEKSPVRLWAPAIIEEGDMVDTYANTFLAEMELDDVTNHQFYGLVAALNGWNWSQMNRLEVGDTILLPTMENDPAEITERRAERSRLAAAASTEAEANAALAANPLGMAAALRQVIAGQDAITTRLTEMEGTTVDSAAIQAAIDKMLVDHPMVSAAQFDLVRQDLEDRIAAGADGTGLSEADVSVMIADAFTDAGLSEAAAGDAVDETLANLPARVTALETTMLNKADVTTVTAVDGRVSTVEDRVAALEKGGMSQTGLWIGGAALALAALALIYSLFVTVSKRVLKDDIKAAAKASALKADALATELRDADMKLATANTATLAIAEDAKKLAVTAVNNTTFVASLAVGKDLKFVGDLPSQSQIDALGDGESFEVRLKQDADEFVITFTVKMDAFGVGEKGLVVDGVKDHRNHIKPRVERIGTLIKEAIGKGKLLAKIDPAAVAPIAKAA